MASTWELIRLIGRENVVKLQQALGPAQTYIPTEATNAHMIGNAIGMIAMHQLCREHGGSTIWIGSGYARAKRNEEILQLLMTGMTQENVSQVFGITARQVRALTQGPRPRVYGVRSRQIQAIKQGIRDHKYGPIRRRFKKQPSGTPGTPSHPA